MCTPGVHLFFKIPMPCIQNSKNQQTYAKHSYVETIGFKVAMVSCSLQKWNKAPK